MGEDQGGYQFQQDKWNQGSRTYQSLQKEVSCTAQASLCLEILPEHQRPVLCLHRRIVFLLQLHRRRDAGGPGTNLGVLLLEFLELYGCSFNYSSLAISVRGEGKYLNKNEVHVEPDITHRWVPAGGLTMEDPLQPGNDLARASFRIGLVRQAFAVAYRQLCRGWRGGGLAKILTVE